jgi:hypothetical protein
VLSLMDIQYAAPLVVAEAIVVVAIVWWFRVNPKVTATLRQVRGLREHFESSPSRGREAFDVVTDASQDQNVRDLLRQTTASLFELPDDVGRRTFTLRAYRDIWTARALLARRITLPVYEAAPNILIGVGLFFTFLFLALALGDVIPALASGADPDAIREAISGLLRNAAGKFATSIAGMGCSLLWSIASKRNLEQLDHEINDLCVAMQRHASEAGAEAAIGVQIGLLSEVLEENRQQVGQLKRFETDFALAIGKALGSQMQPAFEAMATSITRALDALTEKIGTVNEDALRRIVDDLRKMLLEQSGAEMQAFKVALIEVAERLKSAGVVLGEQGGALGKELERGGQVVGESLASGAAAFRDGAQLLEQAMISAKATVNDVDATIERAVVEGRRGVEAIGVVFSEVDVAAGRVKETMKLIEAAATGFLSAASKTETVSEGLEEVVSGQKALTDELISTSRGLADALRQGHAALSEAATALTRTLNEVNDGVDGYTARVKDLHTELDDELSKAISGLNGTVTNLCDGLEDFLEQFPRGKN